MTLDDIVGNIRPGDIQAKRAAAQRQQRLTKPPGSLGRLEDLSIQLAGIFGTARPTVRGTTVIVAAADHGVVAQGVTGYPQAVTAQMVLNFLAGGAAINVMARTRGVDLVIVDAGVAAPLPAHPDLQVVAPGRGTRDITQGPAMTSTQAEACIRAGVKLAMAAAERGASIIGIGDMGIGNTTSASAITAVLTHMPARQTTGRGTGRNDPELAHKISCVERALDANQPDPSDGLDVLSKVGGFEIGVLAGVVLGGATRAAGCGARRLCLRRRGTHRAQPVPNRAGLPRGRPPLRRARSPPRAGAPGSRSATRSRHAAGRGHRRAAGHGVGRDRRRLPGRHGDLRRSRRFGPRAGGPVGTGGVRTLRLAISFLTVLPVAPRHTGPMGPARAYFPLVGLGLGGILAGLDIAARQVLPLPVVGALLVAALLALTRAIHIEGFLDTCDGLLGGRDREARLEILRDSRVGAFAVVGGASLLLLKWTLLMGIPDAERIALLALFPCLSRWGMVATMGAVPYVRAQGLGTAFQAGRNWRQLAFALATAAVAGWLLLGVAGLILLGGATVVALGLGWWFKRMLGGMTGDTYGATNEVAEVVILLLGLSVAPGLVDAPLW